RNNWCSPIGNGIERARISWSQRSQRARDCFCPAILRFAPPRFNSTSLAPWTNVHLDENARFRYVLMVEAHEAMKVLHCRKLAACLLPLSFLAIMASGATYQVSSISELNTRIASAVAGDTIIVQNGVYTTSSSIGVTRVGTAVNPIMIRAETVG